MPNSFFRFRHFVVHQERCAMKVGTDAVLLGAWARGGKRILDIGTGTGVVALMMAQRFPMAQVQAIDIEQDACCQAEENVSASPFSKRVLVRCMSVQQYAEGGDGNGCYDAIVSNPPFFENALKAPGEARMRARHNDSLPYDQLFQAVDKLMAPEGEFTAIIPFDYKQRLEEEAARAGMVVTRLCAVRTTPRKPIKRYLLAFRRMPSQKCQEEGLLEIAPGVRSEWYRLLTADFYL